MKRISLDNGHSYTTAEEAIQEILDRNLWDAIVNMMDDEIRESVADDIAPCTEAEFIAEYLNRANDDIVIG